jgi:protein RecA
VSAAPIDERKKIIQAALTGIKKSSGLQFNRLGDKVNALIPHTSTGIWRLDHELIGIGGVPKGKMIEIIGPESSGKCLPADTYIRTAKGLQTIEEIFAGQGQLASCTARTSYGSILLYNRHNELEESTSFTHNNKRKLKRFTTYTGSEIESTYNHPHLVMNRRGQWVWRRTDKIELGDVMIQIRHAKGGAISEDRDMAYMIGLVLADGHIEAGRVNITNDDQDIKDFIISAGPGIFSKEPCTYDNNECGSIEFHFNTKVGVGEFLSQSGLVPGNSAVKQFGPKVRQYDNETLRYVIQGYMDCEMSVDVAKQSIEVTSASKRLLQELKMLLLHFGILSVVRPKVVKSYPDNNYYRLSFAGDAARLYKEVIGTASAERADTLSQLVKPNGGSTNFDSIPNCDLLLEDLYEASETTREHWRHVDKVFGDKSRGGRITYNNLRAILSFTDWADCAALYRLKELERADYFYDEVINIEDVGEKPTFDFYMPITHSFIANGFVTHNTTLTLHVAAQAQKAGGEVAFVDAEHALSPTYASQLGVDVNNLLVAQPDWGEQALQAVEDLVDTKSISIIIVDSVAALLPKAELEGQIGDSHVGLQARLMGQALRKLVAKCNQSATTILWINQIREKIGVTFGSNETSPGGRALKFYCSVRIDVRRLAQVKVGEENAGNKTKIKCVKNKVGIPFRSADFELMFGKGVDSVGSLVDCAIEHDVWKKTASNYMLKSTGEVIMGRKNVRDELANNAELYKQTEVDTLIALGMNQEYIDNVTKK